MFNFNVEKILAEVKESKATELDLSPYTLPDEKAEPACEQTLNIIDKDCKDDYAARLTVLSAGRLASCHPNQGAIKFWDMKTWQSKQTYSVWAKKRLITSTLSIVEHIDGRLISNCGDQIQVWDANGKCLATMEATYSADALAILSDGRLASATCKGSIDLWNLATYKREQTLYGHADINGWITALQVLDNDRLASASADGTIKIWNVKTHLCEQTLWGHKGRVLVLKLLGDGRLVSGSADSTIKVWNTKTSKCEQTLENGGYVETLAVLPDDRLASTCGQNTYFNLWNLKTEQCKKLSGHSDRVMGLAVLPDDCLASSSSDKSIKVWLVVGRKPLVWKDIKPVIQVLSTGATIQTLNLQKISLTDEDVPALIQALQPIQSLQCLDIHNTQITPLGAIKLYTSFKTHVSLKTIKHLTVDSINFNIELISNNSTTQLDLSNRKKGLEGIDCISPILFALQQNCSIHTLNLQHLNLTDDDVHTLVALLQPNRSLRRLDVRNNPKITKLGAIELHEAFQDHVSLKVIEHALIDTIITQKKQQEPNTNGMIPLILEQMKVMQEMLKILWQQHLTSIKTSTSSSNTIIFNALLSQMQSQQEKLETMLLQQQEETSKKLESISKQQTLTIQQGAVTLRGVNNIHANVSALDEKTNKQHGDIKNRIQQVVIDAEEARQLQMRKDNISKFDTDLQLSGHEALAHSSSSNQSTSQSTSIALQLTAQSSIYSSMDASTSLVPKSRSGSPSYCETEETKPSSGQQLRKH